MNHGHQHDERLRQRQSDAEEESEVAGAVELRGLVQLGGEVLLEERAGYDQVPDAHGAREDHSPHRVQQAQLLDDEVSGDHAAVEEHGDDEQDHEEVPPGHLLARESVGAEKNHRHTDDGADRGVHHRVQEAADDGRSAEDREVSVEGDPAGEEDHLPLLHQVRVGHRRDDDEVQGIDDEHDRHRDDSVGHDHEERICHANENVTAAPSGADLMCAESVGSRSHRNHHRLDWLAFFATQLKVSRRMRFRTELKSPMAAE